MAFVIRKDRTPDVAILGTFGATPTSGAGPLRVSRSLAAALFTAGARADLYELQVPRSRSHRFFARLRHQAVAVPELPPINVVSPRETTTLARGGYRLVHLLGTLGFYTLPLLSLLRARGICSVATLHGLYMSERAFGYPYSWLDVLGERVGLRLVDHAVAVSEPFRTLVEHAYPQTRHKMSVVEHGFDAQGSTATEGRRDPTRIVSVVGTRGVKGVPFLLSAAERLLERGERFTLVLAGPVGDEHERVMESIARLGPCARYIGEQSPELMHRCYSDASIYVQPSHYEPYGIAVLEAMANGLPVVITRECGTSSLVTDGISGFVVDYGDVEALADRLARLLKDAVLRQEVGGAARAAATPCTWGAAAERYEAIYENLLTAGGRNRSRR